MTGPRLKEWGDENPPGRFPAHKVEWAARARRLASRCPAASDVLAFYIAVVEFQTRIAPRIASFHELSGLLSELTDFIDRHGTDAMRETAKLDSESFREAIDDCWNRREMEPVRGLLARLVLQPWAESTVELKPAPRRANEPIDRTCPRCGQLPQVAVLRAQGDGKAASLVCSMCNHEWGISRIRCASCGEQASNRLEFWSAGEFAAVRVHACKTCNRFLLAVDLAEDPRVIPVVDELAAMPLNLWARERGYEKLQPNLAGL